MTALASDTYARALSHDDSKLEAPEKPIFDQWTPRPNEAFGSEAYQQALESMNGALLHHYAANRHHPEHFANGVDDMTLVDLIEMVCDWKAAAFAQGNPVNLDYLTNRFGLSPQLVAVLKNTLKSLEDIQ